MNNNVLFDLTGKIAVVTGGAVVGLLKESAERGEDKCRFVKTG